MDDLPERPRWTTYAGVGLFAGLTIAPSLWIFPLLLPIVSGGVLSSPSIINSLVQFVAVLVMGAVLGPVVTSALWLFTRMMSGRHATNAAQADDDTN